MVQFSATIQKFDQQGEKTGWTYIPIAAALAQELVPGNKKAFRVKGFLDVHIFEGISLIPMGGGDFIMALNAPLRKRIKKGCGDLVNVKLQVDLKPIEPPPELVECLEDEPDALLHFNKLTRSHQNYFINWIRSAKTEPTIAKRVAATINALDKGWDFGQMLRSMKYDRGIKGI
jgi:hypothetical protein